MQEARNVVEFNQSRRSNGPSGNRVLDDCGELAANRLVEAVKEAAAAAGVELHQLAANARLHEMSMLYLDGMEFLRDHAAGIEVGFRQTFFQGFKQSCRKWLLRSSPTRTSETTLSLMEPDAWRRAWPSKIWLTRSTTVAARSSSASTSAWGCC